MLPIELTPSTMSSAGCLASFSARRMPATSLVTPVAVSLWVKSTALISCPLSAARASWYRSIGAPSPHSASSTSTWRPSRWAMSIQRWLNMPKRAASTLSPGRERVGQRGLPGAGAAGREDEGLARGGLEDLLQVLEHRRRQRREVGGAVILHRDVHGPQDPVGRVGGPGNEEKVAAGHARTSRERKDGAEADASAGS